ncbi:MAG: hypothetical protein NTZ18_04625 [Candidatus Komeilibacteria bacterium]|nr:hypothetical protein [Candidatus Komeilibacteria bacterium]
MDYKGTIIEESLENKDVLNKISIISTKVEKVIDEHQTPWLNQWTLDTVEITENQADFIAQELSQSLDSKHNNWYVDFKNNNFHYIIFRNKVFKVDRSNKEQYNEASKYGISLSIPDYQLDFSPNIE